MLAPVKHILPLTNIRRARMLPFAGQVLVREDQRVNASDVIAQGQIPSKHAVLDIRRGLGIPQASAAERNIIRKEGDRLAKDDVIAETTGVFKRIVRAPADGELVAISGGQVLLRLQSTNVDLKAGLAGTVVEVIPGRGAIIEANGALVQAAWGNGRVDNGLLMILAKEPDFELTRANLDVSMRGAVVMGGYVEKVDALQAAAELQLRGLILSSMPSGLLPAANRVNYPIILTEGFGKIPMNESAYRLLVSSEKRDASLNAVFNLKTGERPEVIIPLPAGGEPAAETDFFMPNQTVRILGAPYEGRVGTLVQLRPGLAALPNGLRAPAADVQVDADTRVVVPLSNLEVLN